jgi:hypothetical protein
MVLNSAQPTKLVQRLHNMPLDSLYLITVQPLTSTWTSYHCFTTAICRIFVS